MPGTLIRVLDRLRADIDAVARCGVRRDDLLVPDDLGRVIGCCLSYDAAIVERGWRALCPHP